MNMPDNPPAFPLSTIDGYGTSGMDLRDWFAGQALMGFMASSKRPTTIARDDAEWCYTIADAMLVARSEVTP